MIRKLARNNFFLRWLALHLLIKHREFDRHLDGLGAATGKEESIQPRRRPSGEPIDQAFALGRDPYRHDVIEPAHGFFGELRQLLAPLPNIDDDGAATRIEEFGAVLSV